MQIIIPTKEENAVLESMDKAYAAVSEMSQSEREFLNAMVLRHKPKKVLEVGVARGSSSVVILNALKELNDGKLYSIDLNEQFYHDRRLKTGYIVDNYPEQKKRWKLFTGGLSLKFMDEIGGDIDFCLIDTVHANPGEMFDFLMVLPYLKESAIVVFHDVNLHTHYPATVSTLQQYTNNLLISVIAGEKFLQGNFSKGDWTELPNIAAVKINENSRDNVWEIINLLTLKWAYRPTDEQFSDIRSHFARFYDDAVIAYFDQIIEYQKMCLDYPKGMPLPKKKSERLQKFKDKIWRKVRRERSVCYRLLGIKVFSKHI